MELHLVLVEEPSERIRTRIRIRIRVVTATVLPAANMQLLVTTIGEPSTYSVYFRRAVKKRRRKSRTILMAHLVTMRQATKRQVMKLQATKRQAISLPTMPHRMNR